MPRPGTKVTGEKWPASLEPRPKWNALLFLLFFLLFAPSASIVPDRRHEMAEQATVRQNTYPPPHHGSRIAWAPVSPAHRCVFPMASDGFCSDFRTEYPIRFKMAFCCCIL